MTEEPNIFGPFALIIAQLLTLVTIGTIVIRSGRWLANRKMPRDWYFFAFTIITVILMQVIAIWNFNVQNQQLLVIEQKQSQLQNITLQNQQNIIDIHKKQLIATAIDAEIRNKLGNATIGNSSHFNSRGQMIDSR